jgi:predicted component of type VI protein secretion system
VSHENGSASQYPRLKVFGPDGQHQVVDLDGDRLTIGRLPDCNDVALMPDPSHLVSRQAHCLLELRDGCWWVTDDHSVNGTFLRRRSTLQPVRTPTTLLEDDVICIIGARTATGPLYWELVFEDPHRTRPVGETSQTASVAFDIVQQMLFVVDGARRQRIALRRQERLLLNYMARRNQEVSNGQLLCSFEELSAAVWNEPFHAQAELVRLVSGLRRKVRAAARTDVPFIEIERGAGYRLLI